MVASFSACAGTILVAGAVLLTSAPARAAEYWTAIEGEAAAQLPAPTRTKTITEARLECAEQEWRLVLGLNADTPGGDGDRKGRITIGAERFDIDAQREGSTIGLDVPTDALPPLRAGIRMNVAVTGGEIDHKARFSLSRSRRTIDEIAPRCSKPDMSAYVAVVPGELHPETVLARELLAEEIKAFRAATKSVPSVAAAMHHVGGEQRLLFATICGSSWYYGNSGCNMTVHAQSGDEAWKRVYDTEGVTMHIDPDDAAQNWPDLVALTFDGEKIVWTWMDGAYQPPIAEELRGG